MTKGFVHTYFYKDSPERLRNLIINNKHHINMGYEFDTEQTQPPVHMTATNNRAIKKAVAMGCEWLCITDVDSLVSKEQMEEAIEYINMGYDLVFPYDGRFINHFITPEFERTLDLKDLKEGEPMSAGRSVGSCVMLNVKTYKDIPENENIVGWGYEDDMRYLVAERLGLWIARVPGILRHMDHPRKSTAELFQQENTKKNAEIYKRALSLNKEQMLEWVKNGYK